MINLKNTQFGFIWGPVEVERLHSDVKRGCIFLGIQTPKYLRSQGKEIGVYVTKTGKVRIYIGEKEIRLEP